MVRPLATIAVIAAGLLIAPVAFAKTVQPSGSGTAVGTPAGRPLLSAQDKQFVDEAGASGLAEIALGKIAEKSANPDVKRFAERMVTDHAKANTRLTAIAAQIGAEMPTTLLNKHRRIRDQLAGLHDGAFDRRYMQVTVEDHDQAVELFQRESTAGDNGELKQFAQQGLPILEAHRKMAAELSHRLSRAAAE